MEAVAAQPNRLPVAVFAAGTAADDSCELLMTALLLHAIAAACMSAAFCRLGQKVVLTLATQLLDVHSYWLMCVVIAAASCLVALAVLQR
jgi:hypothetical protein